MMKEEQETHLCAQTAQITKHYYYRFTFYHWSLEIDKVVTSSNMLLKLRMHTQACTYSVHMRKYLIYLTCLTIIKKN